MQLILLIVLIFAAVSSAYRLSPRPALRFQNSQLFKLRMAEEYNPVPTDSENVKNAASVTGGILGFIIGGPVLGAVFAAGTNYLVKQETDAGEAFRGVGKSVVEAYNFLNKVNIKYKVTDQVGASVSEITSSIKTEDNEAVESVKKAVSKVDEINKEYDLVNKGKVALSTAATLSDTAIEKVVELNNKYDFIAILKKLVEDFIAKIKSAQASQA